PWLTPDAARLDKQNGKEWIDALDISPLGKAGIYIQLMADNGQDPARQSYLGNLTQVKGGGLEKYWTDSEVYRCKGGNQQLAMKLAEAVGQDRLILGLPVTDVVQKGNNVVVTCKDGRTLECDDVVLSVPPPVWKKINFNPGIPAMLAPQMGSNVKYLAAVKTRFWKDKKLAPDSMTDGDVSMTWEGTDNQEPDDGAALNCFSGGRASEACRAYPDAASRDKAYAEQLEKLYPGFGENFVQSRFMNWPSDPWVMASYSFPAPGEVTKVGPMLHKGLGKLHFAGEHTSYKFIGYMEGGLNSGATVARRLAARDGLLKETPATRPVTPPAPATRRELQPAR
ncbi:MAG: flavin monoamine oxidase family protein, partial [Tepidisphaeraceae bacterium]